MMRIDKNRGRCATPADFFQHFAVGHLREAAPAVFLRRGHAKHAARYVCLAVDLRRIKIFVQKFAEFSERIIQLDLFRSRNARIRHHPIGNEMSLEQSLGKTERLRACKKQLLRLLNFFLSLRVELVHSVELSKKGRRIVAVGARLSNQVEQLPFENPSVSNPENVDLEPGFEALSSATSLAGPAFGTHAACAGTNDFVAAAHRTGDSHEDATKRDHD